MKKLLLLAALAVFSINVASANGSAKCAGFGNCNEDNSTTNAPKAYGGDGGDGGDANVGNGLGNFSPKAYGGDAEADARAYAKSIGINYNSLTTKQKTSVQTHVKTIQGQQQGQGQIGVVSNHGPQVIITDEKVITYEASSSPAFGPDVNVDQVKVDCPLYVQDGWSIAGTVIAGAGSAGATDAQFVEICALWLAAKNTQSSFDRRDAATAAYCLTFEKTGIKNKRCDGWREDLSGVPADETVASADPASWDAGSDGK